MSVQSHILLLPCIFKLSSFPSCIILVVCTCLEIQPFCIHFSTISAPLFWCHRLLFSTVIVEQIQSLIILFRFKYFPTSHHQKSITITRFYFLMAIFHYILNYTFTIELQIYHIVNKYTSFLISLFKHHFNSLFIIKALMFYMLIRFVNVLKNFGENKMRLLKNKIHQN